MNQVKLSHLFFFLNLNTCPREKGNQQEVQGGRRASAMLDFLWTLQLQPPSLDLRHCRDTPALWFSYLLPLGLSASPCTWPHLVVMIVVGQGVSPSGGSAGGKEKHPDSVSDPDAQHMHVLATPSAPHKSLKRKTQHSIASWHLRQ